jgi:hypothetical protein
VVAFALAAFASRGAARGQALDPRAPVVVASDDGSGPAAPVVLSTLDPIVVVGQPVIVNTPSVLIVNPPERSVRATRGRDWRARNAGRLAWFTNGGVGIGGGSTVATVATGLRVRLVGPLWLEAEGGYGRLAGVLYDGGPPGDRFWFASRVHLGFAVGPVRFEFGAGLGVLSLSETGYGLYASGSAGMFTTETGIAVAVTNHFDLLLSGELQHPLAAIGNTLPDWAGDMLVVKAGLQCRY